MKLSDALRSKTKEIKAAVGLSLPLSFLLYLGFFAGGSPELRAENRPVGEVVAATREKMKPLVTPGEYLPPLSPRVAPPVTPPSSEIPREEKKIADEPSQKKADAKSPDHPRESEESNGVTRNFQAWVRQLEELEISLNNPEIKIDQEFITDIIENKISISFGLVRPTSLTSEQKDLALKVLGSLERILSRVLSSNTTAFNLEDLKEKLLSTLNEFIRWGVILDERERDARFISQIPDPGVAALAESSRVLQALQSSEYSVNDMNDLRVWLMHENTDLLPPDWYARTIQILERVDIPGGSRSELAETLKTTLEHLKEKKESLLQELKVTVDVLKRQELLREIEKRPDITEEMISRASQIEADLEGYRKLNYISSIVNDENRAVYHRFEQVHPGLDDVDYVALLEEMKSVLPPAQFSSSMKEFLQKLEEKIASEDESDTMKHYEWAQLKKTILSVYPEGGLMG